MIWDLPGEPRMAPGDLTTFSIEVQPYADLKYKTLRHDIGNAVRTKLGVQVVADAGNPSQQISPTVWEINLREMYEILSSNLSHGLTGLYYRPVEGLPRDVPGDLVFSWTSRLIRPITDELCIKITNVLLSDPSHDLDLESNSLMLRKWRPLYPSRTYFNFHSTSSS